MDVIEALPGQGVQLGGPWVDLQAHAYVRPHAHPALVRGLGPAGGHVVRAANRAAQKRVKEGQPVRLGVELGDQEGLPVEV